MLPREQSSPRNSLSPSHLAPPPPFTPPPKGPRHLGSSLQKFTQPQRHECASNPEPAAQARILRGHPCGDASFLGPDFH